MPGMPGMPGGMPGMPGMGGPGGAAAATVQPSIERLRVLLVTDKGEACSGSVLVDTLLEEAPDWDRVIVPLSQFKGLGIAPDAKLQSIAVFGNVADHFYVGRIMLKQEDTPLVAKIEGERVLHVKSGEKVTFKAAPQAPGVTARLVWNQDALDPNREDGYNDAATLTYKDTGYYVTRLIVTDKEKHRLPQVDEVNVKVE